MKILFVCKYNRFRSKIAEAFFNKYNKNPKNEAKSAGPIEGQAISPEILEVAKKNNLELTSKPQGLSSALLVWQDLTIVVADNVPKELFNEQAKYGKKTEFWDISDSQSDKIEEMQPIVKSIELKVKDLINRLEDIKA
ncbi:MAG: hypothetical protein WCK90_02345 [archaeon]